MALFVLAAVLDALDGRIARVLNAHVAHGTGDRLVGRRREFRCGACVHRLRDAAAAARGSAGSSCCCTRCASCCGWRATTRCSTWTGRPTKRNYFVGMPAPAGAVGAIGPIAAKMQFGDGWWTSTGWSGLWIVGVLAAGGQPHADAGRCTRSRCRRTCRAVAAGAGDRRGAAFMFPYLTDHGDHRGLRHPHPVRGAQQALDRAAP